MLHFCCGILQVDSIKTDTINTVINRACSVGNLIVLLKAQNDVYLTEAVCLPLQRVQDTL